MGKVFQLEELRFTQDNVNILILAASFHTKEDNYSHQIEMDKNIPQPDELLSWDEYYSKFKTKLPKGLTIF